jgi:beta-N-acetylhexosaminidase
MDLTPADTSSLVTCSLASAIQHRHHRATELVVSHHPTPTEIAVLREQAASFDLVVVGTLNAYAQTEQPALVEALLGSGTPVIVVAMRMPYDLQVFPAAPTYLCSYSLLEPSMEAVAQLLFGEIAPAGRLPVSIPGLYPVGHRAEISR